MLKSELSRRRILIYTVAIVFILFVILLFMEWPYNIKGPCRFLAHHKWSLLEVEPGKLMSKLEIYNPHQICDFHLFQFDRSDFINFSLDRSGTAANRIKKGDVIGSFSSLDNKLRLDELTGQLERAKAEYKLISTGEKSSIQQGALQELKYAESAYNLFESTIKRKKKLFEDNLISQEEWEQAYANSRLLELNVAIAKAKLETVESGEKSETVAVIETEISAIDRQIQALKIKLLAETIRSPINGIRLDSYQENTLCMLAKIDTMVVHIPVKQNVRNYVKSGMPFQVRVPAVDNNIFSGKIIAVGQNAQLVNNGMMFVLTGIIENPDMKLLPGITGYVNIYCDKVPIWTLLQRWWKSSNFLR